MADKKQEPGWSIRKQKPKRPVLSVKRSRLAAKNPQAFFDTLPLAPEGVFPEKPKAKPKKPKVRQDWSKGLELGGPRKPKASDVAKAELKTLQQPLSDEEQWQRYKEYELLKDAPYGEISGPGYKGLTGTAFDALDRVGVDSQPLRTLDDYVLGIGPAERAAARLGSASRGEGEFSGWDAADVALTAPGAGALLGALGKPFVRGTKAVVRAAPEAVKRPLRALSRVEPLVDRPAYTRAKEGPFTVVSREGLEPRANPDLVTARTIGDMRPMLRSPESNPALAMANEESLRVRGTPLSPEDPMPQTSLARQAGMGRAFREAAAENPAYQHAVFERYGEMFPELVEKTGAQNYDQLREAAYQQLGREVTQQFDQLPVRMRFHEGPGEYATPSEMFRDAIGRGQLNVFSGGEPHEFLSKVDPQTGLSQNEMFRAVHDYIGHGATGSTFRPGGEEIAYAMHSRTLSPLAQLALLAETRGQNSLVNYSPLNAGLIGQMNDVRAQMFEKGLAEKLKTNRDYGYWMERGLDRAADLPPLEALRSQLRELGSRFEYAPQKAVLMPPEYLDPMSPGGTPDYLRSVYSPEGVAERGVHMSRVPDLERTDPSFFGTGHRGAEYRGTKGVLPDRTYFYTGPEGTVVPEPVVVNSGGQYAYEAPLSGLYDVDADPEGLFALSKAYALPERRSTLPEMLTYPETLSRIPGAGTPPNLGGQSAIPDLERTVRDYGYKGYVVGAGPQRAAALYDPVEKLRSIVRGERGFAVGGRVKA